VGLEAENRMWVLFCWDGDSREPHSSTLHGLSHLNAVARRPVCMSHTHTTSPPPVAARKRSSSLNCMECYGVGVLRWGLVRGPACCRNCRRRRSAVKQFVVSKPARWRRERVGGFEGKLCIA
jgi:hypothetical protein